MSTRHPKRPCASCPYRLDAERGAWHPQHYQSVLDGEISPMGTVFGCHEHGNLPPSERGFCAGWLLDQKNRDVPSLALRLMLHGDKEALDAFHEVASDVPMFPSAAVMATVNLRAIADGAFASPEMEEKIERAKERRANSKKKST